ncbi:6-phosphogluconolactonase 3 [Monosporozyma servazzii]
MVAVHIHTPQDNLPEKLGEYLLAEQDKALSQSKTFKVAISGGSLVNVLKTGLIDNSKIAPKIKWDQWEIYFVDERIVPLNHPDSNYGAFKVAVLDHLTVKQPKVFPLNASLVGKGPEENKKIAKEYEDLLPKTIDSLLLGCGPDGHTCSLFPDEEHKYLIEEKTQRVMWCYDSPKPPSDRITVTLPVLADAKQIAFVAEGSSKQPIMHEIFDLKNTKLPTALINKLYGEKVTWFVNDEAFTKVETKTF